MKLDKLGECLSYGLVHELMDVQNNSKKVYLKSAYIFMHLNDLLGIAAVRKLKNTTDKKTGNREQCEELLEKSMILLTAELKKKITFTSFEELIKVLNTYLIPEWIYCGCDDLFKYLPDMYEYTLPSFVILYLSSQPLIGLLTICLAADCPFSLFITLCF